MPRFSHSPPRLSIPPYYHSYNLTDSLSPSSGTLTPGTVIFDSNALYTPTSPAKPYIYSSYLPVDEKSLKKLLQAEKDEVNSKKRWKVIIFGFWVLGVVVIAGYWAGSVWCRPYAPLIAGYFASSGNSDAAAGEVQIPPPEVHMNGDMTGYTVAMPSDESLYPLPGDVYKTMCDDVKMKSMMAFEKRNGRKMKAHAGYCVPDEGFLGLEGVSDINIESKASAIGNTNECEMTLTYVVDDFDGREAGIGAIVLGMWMAYGIAMMEGREFFVEQGVDRWIYGDIKNYLTIPPPTSNCKPPPMSRRIPCPRNTAHKLITPATYNDAFGHTFEDEFENPKAMRVMRQKPIFEFLRTGYEAIQLSDEIQKIVADRVVALGVSSERDVVAMQIRRGDKFAREWRWHSGYIPVQRFLQVSRNESGLDEGTTDGGKWPMQYHLPHYPQLKPEEEQPLRIISSDASDIFDDEAVKSSDCVQAQESSVAIGQPGGFLAEDAFQMDEEDTERLAVGYLVDFGVLTESVKAAKDGWVVCGYYGDLCRMMAVGMGWESAIEKGHWVNIDGDFDWFGIRW